ncbi:MAG TPA: hypothetical protein VFG04_27725 [Planctomycetaceae bacterium]|nr:hypothetical protein [Planctomycetaceae bacterium]
MKTARLWIVGTTLVTLCGCSSFSSTMLNRMDDGTLVANPNGRPRPKDRARPYKGIPVALQVPTHLDVFIDETYYLAPSASGDGTFDELPFGRLLNVRTQLIKTKKVVMVDFKRPIAGTLDADAKFTDQQFFSSIDNQLLDTTITDTGALVATILKSATPATGELPTGPTLTGEIKRSRVVAYQRFDINAPDYEQQLEAFVNHHLNDCDHCNVRPCYDPPGSYKTAKPSTVP